MPGVRALIHCCARPRAGRRRRQRDRRAMRSDAITFAIVGGGFLGMTLARRLAAAGRAVTLFEAQPALGGLASAWQLDDVVWDRHYHVTSPADTYLLALLRELDLEHEMR